MSEIVPPEEERRRIEVKSIIRALGMLPVLILLAIGFQLLSGKFVSVNNLSIVVQQASINIVLAAGMTFVILTGGIDLSVGSILAASAMIAVIVSLIPEYGMLGIPAAMAIGLAFGLANGCLISFLKLPPFIVTLGSLTAVRGVARLMGGDTTVFNPELPFDFIGNGTLFGIPWLALIALAVILVSWFILRRTVLGTWIYAVGGNQEAARLTGIKVWLVLLFVWTFRPTLPGSTPPPEIWGTLVGALIIAVLSNGLILTGVSDIWQFIIKGLVIIAAVALDRYRLQGGART